MKISTLQGVINFFFCYCNQTLYTWDVFGFSCLLENRKGYCSESSDCSISKRQWKLCFWKILIFKVPAFMWWQIIKEKKVKRSKILCKNLFNLFNSEKKNCAFHRVVINIRMHILFKRSGLSVWKVLAGLMLLGSEKNEGSNTYQNVREMYKSDQHKIQVTLASAIQQKKKGMRNGILWRRIPCVKKKKCLMAFLLYVLKKETRSRVSFFPWVHITLKEV